MKNIFKILIYFIVTNQVNAQIIISDSISKIPIPFVEIYSESGSLLGSTNRMGEISQELSKKLNLELVYLYHSNYHGTKCQINNNNKILLLVSNDVPTTKLLPEVSVVSGKSKYIKVTSYFRSIQFNNKQPQYFMDGIVEYYISTKTLSVKNFILENRSFKENQIQILKNKGLIQLDFNLVGVPYLEDFLTAQNLKKKYSVIKHENTFDIQKDAALVGHILLSSNKTDLNLSIHSKNNPLKMKLFGTESNLINYNIEATFTKNTDDFKLKELNWFKEIREYELKTKKEKDYTHIDTIHEIFVLDKEFVDEKPKSSNNSFYTFLNKNNYSNEFWNNKKITPLSDSVKMFIDQKMSELK
jgi:hypothetical protein